jgi:hypothetical protein
MMDVQDWLFVPVSAGVIRPQNPILESCVDGSLASMCCDSWMLFRQEGCLGKF